MTNATRGVLAEFIVGTALGVDLSGVRDEWGACDLYAPEGIEVEVKSAAFVQSWKQTKPSSIQFRVPRTRAWDAGTGLADQEARRQADAYVFAVLSHADRATIDPLNVGQ